MRSKLLDQSDDQKTLAVIVQPGDEVKDGKLPRDRCIRTGDRVRHAT
jgi:hypothetical protein